MYTAPPLPPPRTILRGQYCWCRRQLPQAGEWGWGLGAGAKGWWGGEKKEDGQVDGQVDGH